MSRSDLKLVFCCVKEWLSFNALVSNFFQAKFRCEHEAPLSPSQIEFLCEEASGSDQFKFCNKEFKSEMK